MEEITTVGQTHVERLRCANSDALRRSKRWAPDNASAETYDTGIIMQKVSVATIHGLIIKVGSTRSGIGELNRHPSTSQRL